LASPKSTTISNDDEAIIAPSLPSSGLHDVNNKANTEI
jgi:hypothetical protein